MVACDYPATVAALTEYRIPFNRPWLSGPEVEYLATAAASSHLSGDGDFTRRCHALLREEFGYEHPLLTTSCTSALEMCALLLALEPGDEVIVPSFSFVSSANAFLMHGAKPVFADVRPDPMNVDVDTIQPCLTPRTRAIVVVHYAGVACAMDEIVELAAAHGIMVIEDNAHGLGGGYRGRPLGTMGELATLSFHETKNFTGGEGGALVVNDGSLLARAEIIREKGTNRSRFFRGQVDKYTWVDVGSSYLPSELVAAHLSGQLEAREVIQRRRSDIWHRYEQGLRSWAAANGVQLPHVPSDCAQAFHMFYMLMPSLSARTELIRRLADEGILAVFHYLPLHLSARGVRLGGKVGDCAVTEDVSDRLIRLPFYTGLTEVDQEAVLESTLSFHL